MADVINIRVPDLLNLEQYRIEFGDTTAFIEKMTGTQDDLDTFSAQINLTVGDMQNASNEIGARYDAVLISENKATVAANDAHNSYVRTLQASQRVFDSETISTSAAASALDSKNAASQSETNAKESELLAEGYANSAGIASNDAVLAASNAMAIATGIGATYVQNGNLFIRFLQDKIDNILINNDGQLIVNTTY